MFRNFNEQKTPFIMGALFSILLLLGSRISMSQSVSPVQTGKMDLLSKYYSFPEKGNLISLLEISQPGGSINNPQKSEEGFTVKFIVNLKQNLRDNNIIDIPGIFNIRLRTVDSGNRDFAKNYFPFKLKNNSIVVLEASIMLGMSSEKQFLREMTIGVPLSLIPELKEDHEITVSFTKSHFTMYVDGKLADNDFPIGFPDWHGKKAWRINSEFVKNAKVFAPAISAVRNNNKKDNYMPAVQYWTPEWHNAWVGDVATIFYKGRYHVFYLFDRRHHTSKLGVGGHYFEHFSTQDFKVWTEHEPATPIEEQWETFGTGSPFIDDGKLCIAYGLHTSRIYPDERTQHISQIDYFDKNKKTGFFKSNFENGYPSGSTYAVSQDGLSRFKKSGNIFHYCENPSVYKKANGKYRLLANYRSKGTWESDKLDGGWYLVNEDFPLGGDCTFYFHWGKFEYIIGGFVDLWRRPLNGSDNNWKDIVREGEDFYNGIGAPSISGINNNRFIMSGWFPIHGWGGPFVIHEMVQYNDGRIGTKWMKELEPETEEPLVLAKSVSDESKFSLKDQSFLLTFEVQTSESNPGKLALTFTDGQQKENGCEMQIDLKENIAQYSTPSHEKFSKKEKSLRQGGAPHLVGNYAIEKLIGTNKPFLVRVYVKNDPKITGTIIDTEIAGQRTMITYRPDLNIRDLLVRTENTVLTNLKIFKTK